MKQAIKKSVFSVIGVAITALAVSAFIVPNKLVSGGVSGVSTILYYATGLPVSVTNAAVNLLLILVGIRILGKTFIIKTFVCSMLLSVFIELFSHIPPVTDNLLLATLFGGVLYGLGIGITLSQTASTGGTDILARIVQYFLPHVPIGKLLLFIDGVVILASYCVFRDMNLILFGILALIISTFSIDYFIRKLNVSKITFIITNKGEELAKHLIDTSHRGVTVIDVKGAFSGEQKKMLMCALKESELPELQRKITELDQSAFTIFAESQQIIGNGFHVYK